MKKLVLLPLLLISLGALAAPKELTVSVWKNLNEAEQLDILTSATYNDEKLDYTNYEVIEYRNHSLVTNENHKNYLREIYKQVSESISLDNIEQSIGSETGYGLITVPVIHLTVLVTKDSKEILGTYADIYFQGAYKEEVTDLDFKFYFTSAQEAIIYGFDPHQDISWSGDLFFNNKASKFQGQLLTFEWSGW